MAGAVSLLVVQLAVFGFAWRLGSLTDPGGDRRATLVFLLLGTVLTLQAMVVAGVAWLLVALSRTELEFDAGGLSLSHPWRQWHGSWSSVARTWHQRGWLVIDVATSLRRWYVRADRHDPAVAAFREYLPAGAWLEGADLRAHLARRILPVLGIAAITGALAVWGLLQLLDRLRGD
ncbi:MAG TPA: hypothetical protein VF136_04075 [Methylomirabilota bacterium]